MDTDRIERTVHLNAPVERVWTAIADARAFGTWFGAEIDGAFVTGQPVTARIVPTAVDADVARMQEPHRGTPMRLLVERVEPMRLLSFRWHPFAIDQGVDYAGEPTTLVTFELAKDGAGTRLTITESGFDVLPEGRRAPAREANEGGWEHQMRLIARYLTKEAGAWTRA